MVFSQKHGLLSIGGQDDECLIIKDIYQLGMDQNDQYGSQLGNKWEKLTDLDVGVSKCSVCLYRDNISHTNSLFIVGGETSIIGAQNKTQIFNLDKDEWEFAKSSEISRFDAGIYCDKDKQRIYLMGGRDKDDGNAITNIHEYYDIQRNEWFCDNIPLMKLGCKPLIWSQGDLLYTAGFLNYGFSMQYIDLRLQNKEWIVMDEKVKNLSHIPYPQAICKLLM